MANMLPNAQRAPMTFASVMEFSIAWGDRSGGIRNGKLLSALADTFTDAPRNYFVMRQRAMRQPAIREQYAEHVAHLEAMTAERVQLRTERRFAPVHPHRAA